MPLITDEQHHRHAGGSFICSPDRKRPSGPSSRAPSLGVGWCSPRANRWQVGGRAEICMATVHRCARAAGRRPPLERMSVLNDDDDDDDYYYYNSNNNDDHHHHADASMMRWRRAGLLDFRPSRNSIAGTHTAHLRRRGRADLPAPVARQLGLGSDERPRLVMANFCRGSHHTSSGQRVRVLCAL